MRYLTHVAVALASTAACVGCGGQLGADTNAGGAEAPKSIVQSTETARPDTKAVPDAVSRADVTNALRSGAREASQSGVRIYAAVSSDQWPAAAQVDGEKQMRMWSTAKAVTAVAALRAADQTQSGPTSDLSESIQGALERSENCRQRNVVLWLQQMIGGPAEASAAIREEFQTAGSSDAMIPEVPAAVPADCVEFLRTSGVSDQLGPALQLGTATWTPVTGSRFAWALAAGRSGQPGDKVFSIMRRPKKSSREASDPGGYTADLDWGAGKAMENLRPAYKAGWGGTEQGDFIAGQIVSLRTATGPYGVFVFGSPAKQPALDDPGVTAIPAAVEAVLRRLAPVLGSE